MRAGERDAYRVLVERYQGRAYRLALRMLRSEEAARDAVQEAFVKAYRALPRFQGRSRFYTWLYRMVVNQCLDARRRERSDRHVPFEEAGGPHGEGPEAPSPEVHGRPQGPAAGAMRKELRERIAAAVEALPESARETFLLREVDGLSYAEIARSQGIPKGTVMSRLHNARQRLRETLLAAGVEAPGAAAGAPESGRGPEEEA